jgi:uncharacterized membrane protein YhaH (DUF805 family)
MMVFGRIGVEPLFVDILAWSLAVLWAPLWVISACGRLHDLGRSRWFVLIYALPWGAFAWTLRSGQRVGFFISFSALIAAELPLVLLPGRSRRMEGQEIEPA